MKHSLSMCVNCSAPLVRIPTVRMRITLDDGVTLSVQASSSAYCTPRDDDGPYTHVEVGFIRNANDEPMSAPAHWAQYADCPDYGVDSDVYAYVPVYDVECFIAEHGGRKYFT